VWMSGSGKQMLAAHFLERNRGRRFMLGVLVVAVYDSCADLAGGGMLKVLGGIFLLLIFGLFAVRFVQGQTSIKPAPIFIHCGTLIDGKSEKAQKNVFLEIEGDKIAALPGAAPGSAKVIDLSNETCLPGLIDTHTHVLLNGDVTAEDY